MISDVLRQFWLPGINAIGGKAEHRFIDTINQGRDYVIYTPIKETEFDLSIINIENIMRSIAADINRFGCASIESLNEIHYQARFPNSHAWKCIKCYYAAYYSAHAILRSVGISCTNFDRNSLHNIEDLADVYGQKNGIAIQRGNYSCLINANTIECRKISPTGNLGSHEQLWKVFLKAIDLFITNLTSQTPTIEIQATLIKLQELRDNLTYMGSNDGSWLSHIRNEINYKHPNDVWFPYKDSEKYFDRIRGMIRNWELDPLSIDLSTFSGRYLMRFLNSCLFIVSLYKTMAYDMSKRCPKGISFQASGILAFINKMNA